MKPMKAFISLEDGMRILLDCVAPITRREQVGLLEATGRVLAEPILAGMSVPPFPRGAMDGYAVIAEDTFGAGNFTPVRLHLVEVIHAADIAEREVTRGTCIQVATGSPIPRGADAVVQVEDTELEGDPAQAEKVKIYKPVYPRQNVSPQGEDIQAGREVLAAETRLDPSKIGVLAALGITQVPVFARPTVAVIPSGNEILTPGDPLEPGKIYDINSYTLAALIQETGGIPLLFPIMKDTLEDVRRILCEALACDMTVLSGGSSVGERDVMVEAVESLGEVKFHGIAVKPGKPTLCGVIQGKLILGMPGYPTSCLTNGYGLLVPVLRKLARLAEPPTSGIQLPMSRRYTSTIGRHQYLPVRVEGGEVVPAFKESGAITSMADAEGYIEIPANVDLVEKGEPVLVKFF
ncbi:MAG: molybdenum cofactor biosynthesis protein [candidate division NC10 bacterium]|nr:molybdenum cofactor biosynthesis protein [candidate division NC10 bacterium]MBI2456203.1 molybdenum cofactor biosynthesis protein [candidate division NC10 bacterium]MBI3120950.1 molybdenum cofactor biosynthesis protein [candidate division NC10 bacterium]